MLERILVGALSAFVLLISAPETAMAGGFEYPAPGTRALGRGGASLTRADDPVVLLNNPANLANLGGMQLTLQAHVAFYSACVDRSGTVGMYASPSGHDETSETDRLGLFGESPSAFGAADTLAGVEHPEVCNSGPPGPVPELAFAWRVNDQLGLGIGLLAPSAVGHTIWGDDVQVGDRTYRGIVDGRPSPLRYGIIEAQLLIFFPTIGLGWSPNKMISFGLSFGWGIGLFDFTNVARPVRGEDYGLDVLTELSASDMFIPRLTASVQVQPHDNVDIMVGFMMQGDVNAKGDVTLTSGYYREESIETLNIPNAALNARQPWQVNFGIRYADRTSPRPRNRSEQGRLSGRVEDSMQNERWDLELNVVYEFNSRVDDFVVALPQNPSRDDGKWIIEADRGLPAALPTGLTLPHNWQDQLSIRLGGDFNVIPGTLAIRAGASYETLGVSNGYEQTDFMPFTRVGGHAGATLRLGRFDISLAYAYIHQFNRTVTDADAQVPQVNAESTLAEEAGGEPTFGSPTIVNAGTYTSRFHVVSLGLTYHIR